MKKHKNSNKFGHLMQILSVPRLNGSNALKQTRRKLSEWIDENEIPHSVHRFRLYPYFNEIGGAWLITTQILLATSIWFHWGWISLVFAVVSLVVIVLETMGIHLVSRLMADEGENIIIELEPENSAEQEIVLSAHYDSKTELFSDRWRVFFMGKLPLAMGLALVLGVMGAVNEIMRNTDSTWANVFYIVAATLTVPQLVLFLPLGVNFIFGRFASPSQGVVDNGAGCAILLEIARRLTCGEIVLQNTKISITLFCGEEVVVQGSRSWVASRTFPLPTLALNLELMGQNGDYVVWKNIGSPLQSRMSDTGLNELLNNLIDAHTDAELEVRNGPAGTDSLPFLTAKVPATSLATLDNEMGFGGLHTPKDNLTRIDSARLVSDRNLIENLLIEMDSNQQHVSDICVC